MRAIFAGTGAFGIPSLGMLHAAADVDVVLVVSQPDRLAGRKKVLTPPPLAARAAELGLELFQPERINRPEARERLEALRPDVLIVVAYGQILRPEVLAIPRLGCVNLHGSLLPAYRGASPIQAAVLAGDRVTGNTVMLMNEGMDTGPMLRREALEIGEDETAGELHDRLAEAGAPLLLRALRELASGQLEPEPQDDAAASTCGLITKADGEIDWSAGSEALVNHVRGMSPWPGAFTHLLDLEGQPRLQVEGLRPVSGADAAPGTVLEAGGDRLVVACGGGAVALERVKLAGKRSLDAASFLRGVALEPGQRLGARS